MRLHIQVLNIHTCTQMHAIEVDGSFCFFTVLLKHSPLYIYRTLLATDCLICGCVLYFCKMMVMYIRHVKHLALYKIPAARTKDTVAIRKKAVN